MYVMPSPHEQGTIWVGTDDGLVHITRDEGENWEEVTPNGVEDAMINSIEVSPHDPATAYAVATRYKFNDFTPHIYKTENYGQSWERIVDGIGEESWVRVVREDKLIEGLLYAGTELGIYVSFNGGDDWQPFQNNLPVVPITDLQIRNNDLVASTQGRGFWILDDLSPVQQISEEVAGADHYLFKPGLSYQVGGSQGDGLTEGQNPPNGALIYYSFKEEPDTSEVEVRLDVLNSEEEIIRTYAVGNKEAYDHQNSSGDKPQGLPIGEGLNRLVWDFNTSDITSVPGFFIFGGTSGYEVEPGVYTARFTVGDQTTEQDFQVKTDLRVDPSEEGIDEKQQLLAETYSHIDEIHKSVNQMISVRDQVKGLMKVTEDQANGEEIAEAGKELAGKITDWIESVIQPDQETFQDVINFPNKLNAQFIYLYGIMNGNLPPITEGSKQRLSDLEDQWNERKQAKQQIINTDVAAFNAIFDQNNIPAVITEME